MIIYPSNPKLPGVSLNGAFGPDHILKALKYVIKNSN